MGNSSHWTRKIYLKISRQKSTLEYTLVIFENSNIFYVALILTKNMALKIFLVRKFKWEDF